MRRFAFVLALLTGGLTPSARLTAQQKERPDLVAPTDALSPADERKAFTVPDGFDVQLVAAEPDIGKPMQIAFDAKGRLWVATSRHYPFAVEPGKGTDKVYVLSDFGDDGKARKVTLFADNLNIPIGIMPLPSCDGCIVSNIGQTCEILKLTDTNGDGKADKSETLFSGFGTRDTHGMVNSFTLMPDGWVYACHGYLNQSKVKGRDGHEIEIQSGNMLRFRLDGSRIEVYTRGQVNPFGLAVDPWFNLYTADCHSKPMTALIPGAVYESFGKPHDGLGYGPNMIGYDPGGTGMCGLAWYDADHFPKEHLGMMYLGNVITNRVNAAKIEWTGATPNAVQKQDLIASTDRWFRPVDVKLGPDGAVYVSDFYNKIIGHYEVDLKHPGRDRDRGRIWRVIKKGEPPKMPFTDLTTQKADEIDKLLGHPNLTVRLLATNALIRHKEELKAHESESAEYTAHRMWVDEARSWRGPERKRQEVASNNPLVEAHQYRIEKARNEWDREHPLGEVAKRKGPHLIDVHPAVVRAAVEELAARPLAENIKPLVELIPKIQSGDTHLRHAARIALRNALRDEAAWTEAEKLGADDKALAVLADVAVGIPSPTAARFLVLHLSRSENPPAAMVEHVARYGDDAHRANLLRHSWALIDAAEPETFARGARLLRDLLRGAQTGGKQFDQLGDWFGLRPAMFAHMAKDANAAKLVAESLVLLPALCSESARQRAGPLSLAGLRRIAEAAPISEDARAVALLGLGRMNDPASTKYLIDVVTDPKASTAIRESAIVALAQVTTRDARAEVNLAMKGVPYRVAVAASANMASTPGGGAELFAGVKAGFVPARVLQDKIVLERLKASKVPDWEKQVADLTRGLPAADARLAALIKARGDKFSTAKADKAEGAKLFVKHCGACHAIGNTGGKLAPQLDGVGIRGLERVLEDVLDPNRNVDAAFRARVLNLADGTTKTGLMVKVDGEVLVMADDQGKEFRVPLKDIEKNRETALSPMPANVAEVMTEAEFFHLLAYLLDQKAKDAPGTPKSFKPLFNGTDLAGWHGWKIHDKGAGPIDFDKMTPEEKAKNVEAWTADAKKHWSVQNGELVNDGHGAYLTTDAEYGDIELLLEYKTVAKADSGIYLRATPQVQIWDWNQKHDPKNPTRRPHLGSGGLFNNHPDAPGRDPLVLADKPFGEWNTFRILQVGERTSVWLNGKLVVDHARMENYWDRKQPLRKKGPILLQTHGGEIRWRNIQVREIGADEANAILRRDTSGFESVFNGKDLTGWTGVPENYEVIDGAIVCKPKKGGVLHTAGEYADFVARLEYKLPPGGNNGLAIRYPGAKKHAATQGMCEIQILDDEATKYAKLDPRQFNGSAYGMAAATRGYLRPIGEWNVMEVTAKGPRLQVELNGTRILDVDMSTIKEFKDKQEHPGKDRPSGHFGFCGHNDPVAFRNIEIKRLK